MGFGLFGKLPDKRDFVALRLPRAMLEPFETWLQAAMASARDQLGRDFPDHYMVAPIWRFWIGDRVFGLAAAGAITPSVDAVGRTFPLAIAHCAVPGEALAPPTLWPMDDWYIAIETRLLQALEETAAPGDPARLVDGLEPPPAPPPPPAGTDHRHATLWSGDAGDMAGFLEAQAAADHWLAARTRSYWWTRGPAGGNALLLAANGLPAPEVYAAMLRGRVP